MKEGMSNPARFWLGVVLIAVELIGLSIYGLTLLDWTWITKRVVLTFFCITAIVMYNIIAGILILNGSKKE